MCAVPYLRDRDIRIVEAGESIEDKNSKLIEGVQKHYAEVCKVAEKKQKEYEQTNQTSFVPVIEMRHLFRAMSR